MKKNEKKEILNNWPNLSHEERAQKLEEVQSLLSEKKYKKFLISVKKIEENLQELNENNEEQNYEYESNHEEHSDDNYVTTDSEENHIHSDDEHSHDDYVSTNSEEDHIHSDDEGHSHDDYVSTDSEEDHIHLDEEHSHDDYVSTDSEEDHIHSDDEEHSHDEFSTENHTTSNDDWIINDDEINVQSDDNSYDSYFEEMPQYTESIMDSELSNENNSQSTEYSNYKKQIGSDERSWNKNSNIIYSQEELIYRLTNSKDISEEEYRMLLISAQKKIEFIQLLIEKSRVKNAAYSYDFLNSMCWRVDKALKTFLATNKR